jgi:type I restriction enzyme S subunit
MAFKEVLVGDYFKFEKGLGYKGEFLVEESEVALIGMDSHEEGGGYKKGSEKPYSGPYKPEHVAETGDVIFAATEQGFGLLASPLMVPESEEYETFIYSHHLLTAFVKKDGFLPEYLYNIYRVKKYRDKASYGDAGSTVRALPSVVLEEQLVPLPDLETQEAINELISLLDQQIEINKSLANNLEELAKSIYKSWFVDFEPVHAKSLSEKPFGVSDVIASLFPSSFVETEIGLLPQGWEVRLVKDKFSYCGGGTPSTKIVDYWNGDHLWTTPRDLSKQRGIVTVETERKLTDKGLQKISSRLLPADSVLLSSRAPIGYVSIAGSPTAINQGFIGFPKQDEWPTMYIFCWLHTNMHEIIAHSGGGTFSEISKTAFGSIMTAVPDDKIIKAYGAVTESTLQQLKTLSFQQIHLEKLRIQLLADVIDGKIPRELIEG